MMDKSCTEHIAIEFNLPEISSFIWTFLKADTP